MSVAVVMSSEAVRQSWPRGFGRSVRLEVGQGGSDFEKRQLVWRTGLRLAALSSLVTSRVGSGLVDDGRVQTPVLTGHPKRSLPSLVTDAGCSPVYVRKAVGVLWLNWGV